MQCLVTKHKHYQTKEGNVNPCTQLYAEQPLYLPSSKVRSREHSVADSALLMPREGTSVLVSSLAHGVHFSIEYFLMVLVSPGILFALVSNEAMSHVSPGV